MHLIFILQKNQHFRDSSYLSFYKIHHYYYLFYYLRSLQIMGLVNPVHKSINIDFTKFASRTSLKLYNRRKAEERHMPKIHSVEFTQFLYHGF